VNEGAYSKPISALQSGIRNFSREFWRDLCGIGAQAPSYDAGARSRLRPSYKWYSADRESRNKQPSPHSPPQDTAFRARAGDAAIAQTAHCNRYAAGDSRHSGVPAGARLLDGAPWRPHTVLRIRDGATVSPAQRRLVGTPQAAAWRIGPVRGNGGRRMLVPAVFLISKGACRSEYPLLTEPIVERRQRRGLVAEWLRRGLQILAPRFDSGRGLQCRRGLQHMKVVRSTRNENAFEMRRQRVVWT
jgi:hypothetical protein